MTTKEIMERIQHIRDRAADPEAAHANEDKLRADFIRYVATLGSLSPLAQKAKLVLTTDDIEFARWCA